MRHRTKKPRSLELSPIDMDTADANGGNNMYVRGESVGGSPTGNVTHQYADELSLEEADLYERRMEEMKKGRTTSTNLKTVPPPLNKGRADIDQAAFQVGDFVEVAEDLSADIPGRHCHGVIGYVKKVEVTGCRKPVSVKYDSTAKSNGTESGIHLSRVKA